MARAELGNTIVAMVGLVWFGNKAIDEKWEVMPLFIGFTSPQDSNKRRGQHDTN